MKLFAINMALYMVATGLFLCQETGIAGEKIEEKFDLTLQVSCLPVNVMEAPSRLDILIQFQGTQGSLGQGRMIESSGIVSYPNSIEPVSGAKQSQLTFVFPGFGVSLKKYCAPPGGGGQKKYQFKGKYRRSSPYSTVSFLTPSLGECKLSEGKDAKLHEAVLSSSEEQKEYKVSFGQNTTNPYEFKFNRNISISAPPEDELEIGLSVD